MKACRLVLFALCVLLGPCAQLMAEIPHELQVCADAEEYPPFTYLRRDGSKKTDIVSGYNSEYLHLLLAASGRSYRIELLPWSRCIALAGAGRYDIVLDGSKLPEREKIFAFPRSHYTLTLIAIFSKQRPQPRLDRPQDLAAVDQCAIRGWIFPNVPRPPAAAEQARSFEVAATRLKAGNCAVLIYYREILDGWRRLDGDAVLPDSEFGYATLPWVPPEPTYMMVSRALPYRDELVELLNQGIDRMNKSGEADRLLHRQLSK